MPKPATVTMVSMVWRFQHGAFKAIEFPLVAIRIAGTDHHPRPSGYN